jgi:hypothetical protein
MREPVIPMSERPQEGAVIGRMAMEQRDRWIRKGGRRTRAHPAHHLRVAAYRILALRGRRVASGMADPPICSPDPEPVELLKGMAL